MNRKMNKRVSGNALNRTKKQKGKKSHTLPRRKPLSVLKVELFLSTVREYFFFTNDLTRHKKGMIIKECLTEVIKQLLETTDDTGLCYTKK